MLQEVKAAEEGTTRKKVALGVAEKGAKKAAQDAEKAAAELAALEQREQARARDHGAAQQHSFQLQAALEVPPILLISPPPVPAVSLGNWRGCRGVLECFGRSLYQPTPSTYRVNLFYISAGFYSLSASKAGKCRTEMLQSVFEFTAFSVVAVPGA